MVKRVRVNGLKHQKEKRSMDHFAGLDISVKEASVCIVDETGKIAREVKVASEPEALLAVLKNPAYHFKRIGLEAGPLSQWLFSALAEAELPVVCVETRHMQAVLKAQINKTDRNDQLTLELDSFNKPISLAESTQLAQLVIVSNRVAIPDKNAKARAGGLEVAVKAALKQKSGIWFGWSGKVATRTKIDTQRVMHDGITYITLDLSKEDHHEYYNGFTNRVLWPILHYRVDLAEFSRRDLSGYLRVNDHFARELHEELEPDDLVWVHDYHLIPLAKALRERGHKECGLHSHDFNFVLADRTMRID